LTNSPTATVTATPTESPTSTTTPTATPAAALIVNTNGQGVAVRAEPGGRIVSFVAEGSPILVLYQRAVFDAVAWIEIALPDGTVGWLPARHVALAP
jgi:hypothetical protein